MMAKVHGISPVNFAAAFSIAGRAANRPRLEFRHFSLAGAPRICRDVEEIPARIYTEHSSYILCALKHLSRCRE
jgi:hypothetical protein